MFDAMVPTIMTRPLPQGGKQSTCDEKWGMVFFLGMLPRSRETKGWRMPRVAVAAVHMVLALALLFGMVQSGGRYFYCEALGLLPSDPCASAACREHHEGTARVLSERRADCCEIVTLEALPQAAQAAVPAVSPAPFFAILPAAYLAAERGFAPVRRDAQTPELWRPPPLASGECRAKLGVFLI